MGFLYEVKNHDKNDCTTVAMRIVVSKKTAYKLIQT